MNFVDYAYNQIMPCVFSTQNYKSFARFIIMSRFVIMASLLIYDKNINYDKIRTNHYYYLVTIILSGTAGLVNF